jgi:hypothetical protein
VTQGRGESKKCVIQHANVSITTEVISFTLAGQSDSGMRGKTKRKVMKMITPPLSHLPKPEPYQTLWLRPGLREQGGGAARLIEKGVVCWLHGNRGLLLARPIPRSGMDPGSLPGELGNTQPTHHI